jgi:L-serine dehydratase
MQNFPSIFNDVIGPIMRGPSSSHTAASWRVGKMAVQLLQHPLSSALVEFDQEGAWVTNYRAQGTVLGMDGGLLQIDMADNEMKRTDAIAQERGIDIRYRISTFANSHPNSMQVKLTDTKGQQVEILAASLGGGTFELQKVDGFPVQMNGDFYELFIWANRDIEKELQGILPEGAQLFSNEKKGAYLYVFESYQAFDEGLVHHIERFQEVDKVASVLPIMPIISGRQRELPFSSIESLIAYSRAENKTLGELGLLYEQHRSGLSEEELIAKMENLIKLIEGSIKIGLAGTDYRDRILPQQSHLIRKAEKSKKILQGSIINKIVANVAAIMEAKSALEVIVANPTAGSCGTVGAAMTAVAEEVEATMEDKVMAYYAAGLVGAYFAMGPGFSAEEHGCQVECGASAGMAAAGIVELFGGSAEQALGAGSMAIQNMIGLVCDPIADRVEAPCLGKNTSAAVNALSSATMAVAGFAHLIPLDQVLETVQRVSADMPTCVKCTGLGGLAITPAAMALKEKLDQLKS